VAIVVTSLPEKEIIKGNRKTLQENTSRLSEKNILTPTERQAEFNVKPRAIKILQKIKTTRSVHTLLKITATAFIKPRF
jgi:hypothetical protein